MKNKRVVVGMSGGLDSSVAAYLLVQEGYEVIGVQMEYWSEEICEVPQLVKVGNADKTVFSDYVDSSIDKMPLNKKRRVVANKCCSDESMMITREVCNFLNIPFYALNVRDTFKEKIVDYYMDGFAKGDIPNPCTECNRTIKFGELFEFAMQTGADYMATGHYASIFDLKGNSYIKTPVDSLKDQSYFLYALSQKQLKHILFPLADLTKEQVREVAVKAGLNQFKKTYKESQGLCFYSEKSPEAFLERHLPDHLKAPGNFIDHQGNVLGKHTGAGYYTIGQRKGLGIGGLTTPYFVTSINFETNEVTVGEKEFLYSKDTKLRNVFFTDESEPTTLKIEAKIRYRMAKEKATLSKSENGEYILIFDEPVYAMTPGQVAVFMIGNIVIGGGIITG